MSRDAKARTGGFTIIEVLIVLAIAGLIMLIVFQAIPTVLRNSRNSDRKRDANAILQAVSHYELNHSGNFPDDSSNFLQYTKLAFYRAPGSDPVVEYDPSGSPSTDSDIVVYAKSASFQPDSHQPATTAGAVSPVTDIHQVRVYKYQRCDANADGGSSSVGASYYDAVALFAIETASGFSSQCEQL
jgi:prepilin-type N-terminal cleavage/methylation domain-containing protein